MIDKRLKNSTEMKRIFIEIHHIVLQSISFFSFLLLMSSIDTSMLLHHTNVIHVNNEVRAGLVFDDWQIIAVRFLRNIVVRMSVLHIEQPGSIPGEI